MAAITTADFASLTDDIQSDFQEYAAVAVADMIGPTIFDEKTNVGRKTWDHLVLHGIGGIREVAEGEDYPAASTNEGDSITYTQRQFGKKCSVTKQMRMFDLRDRITSVVKTSTQEAFDLIDQSYADVLGNGQSTSYTDVYGGTVSAVGPDGLELFHTAHTNNINSVTYRNQIKNSSSTENPPISRDAMVQARVDARVYSDPNGLVRPVRLDKVLVAPQNEDAALRFVLSPQLPGVNENDINPLQGAVEVITWERLQTRSDGTDTSAYWYMFDSRNAGETLKSFFAQAPMITPPEVVHENANWDYVIDYLYAWGIGFQAYVWGSDATSS